MDPLLEKSVKQTKNRISQEERGQYFFVTRLKSTGVVSSAGTNLVA
jgi:hypothetical protein